MYNAFVPMKQALRTQALPLTSGSGLLLVNGSWWRKDVSLTMQNRNVSCCWYMFVELLGWLQCNFAVLRVARFLLITLFVSLCIRILG